MIQFEAVKKTYVSGKQQVHALNGIDLTVRSACFDHPCHYWRRRW